MNMNNVTDEQIAVIKAILDVKGRLQMKFTGTSMSPTIPTNCILEVIRINEVNKQNIYVYIDNFSPTRRLVCHRLIKIIDDLYIFKGDNRSILDHPVQKDSILGEVESWNF